MARGEATRAQVVQTVLNSYLNLGRPLTPDEIAARLGISSTTARRICEEDPSIVRDDVVREVREKNYGTVRCERLVAAYVPSRALLRSELNAARIQLAAKKPSSPETSGPIQKA